MCLPFVSSLIISSAEKILSSFDERAEPIAAKRWESSTSTTASPSRPSTSINLAFNSVRKCNGPPRKATLPLIGLPQASPLIV